MSKMNKIGMVLLAVGVAVFLIGVYLTTVHITVKPFDANTYATDQAITANPTIQMGKLPSDICMSNGQPILLQASRDTGYISSGTSLTYINNKGDLVVIYYQDSRYAPLSNEPSHTSIWSADLCPAEAK